MVIEGATSLPHVYRVTKYDPADRDERGWYRGPEDTDSDHGPVEDAYLAVVAAFAEDNRVTHLTIRDPSAATGVDGEPPAALTEQFGPDLAGYYDGSVVPLASGVALVQLMLRGNGGWCRLEADDRFFVHVGWDQYVYVGTMQPCPRATALADRRGLFVEPLTHSPYDPALVEEQDPARSADDGFWSEVADLATRRGAVLLEEGYVLNAARWHRVTSDSLETIRAGLAPRARLLVWPDLGPDMPTALRDLSDADLAEVVWQDPDGRLHARVVDGDRTAVLGRLAEARAARVISLCVDERHPLLAAVAPDTDGVLRARWRP